MTDKEKILKFFSVNEPKMVEILSNVNLNEWFSDSEPTSIETFRKLCRAIIGQQLSGKVANTIYQRFCELLSQGYEPMTVLSITPETLRDVGLSWAKVNSVIDLSNKIQSGEVQFDKLPKMNDEEIIVELVKVKGIGRWTAEMFLMFSLNRENIFSWGDLGLKNGLKKYMAEIDLNNVNLRRRVESWSPYKTYGAIGLWTLLDME